MSTCCPTESKQIPQINFSPERRSQQREEPGKRVAPAAHHAKKAHQDVKQQRRPDLPADRVGAVAQKIAQLQALLDLFKEHFDLPAAAIQIGHTGWRSNERLLVKNSISRSLPSTSTRARTLRIALG